MCVIAVKPKNIKLPNEELRKEMFEYNPDGAGFAYSINKRVYIEKGFMTLKEFEDALSSLETKIKKDYDKDLKDISMLFHYRIGTHGPNNRELTHPFPISDNKKHIEALDLYADVIMAHNGTIRAVSPNTGWSDTTQYIKDVLFPLYRTNPLFFKNEAMQGLITNTINGSRFVFLDRHGDFVLLGDWKDSEDEDLKGLKFSNLNHEYTPSYSNGYWANYGNYTYPKYEYKKHLVTVKKLPLGTYILRNSEVDKDMNLAKDVRPKITDGKNTYYVDKRGDIYVSYTNKKGAMIYPATYYTYATKGLKREDIMAFYTSIDPALTAPEVQAVVWKASDFDGE